MAVRKVVKWISSSTMRRANPHRQRLKPRQACANLHKLLVGRRVRYWFMVGRRDTPSGRKRPAAPASAKIKPAVDIRQVRADDFRYLIAVARSGTRRSAALDLGVDHTTVSRRIRALEKILGVRLIERGAAGWELTEIGRRVAERARAIEESVQEAVDAAVGEAADSLRGRVRVTAPDGFGTLVVTPALARLRMKHPHLSVELLTATRQMNLQQSGFDVAIAVGATLNSRLVSK